jgi:hypothetical protein
MLSWKTQVFLVALGLLYPVVMGIRELYRKKREEAMRNKSQGTEQGGVKQ